MFKQKVIQDKVALITGGGTGLGLEIAKVFAGQGAGIAITSRSMAHLTAGEKEISKITDRVFSVACDVREPEQVSRMKEAVLERFGRIDILVNNAAGNFIYPADRLPLKGWKSVIDIVLNGSFYCSQIVGREMIKQKYGRIVNILATYAWTGGPGTIHSASAKAGVLAMTRTLAVEWAQYGIRVNAVAPGAFDTVGASQRLWPSEDIKQRLVDEIPLKRFARTQEVSNAVLYLISPYADYINGECLTIDGGAWLGKGIGNMNEVLERFVELREQSRKARQNGD